MKLRHVLLAGTAAGPVASPAVASDLLLAVDPIDYVAVCSSAGDGYIAIPGTQTCLQVVGELEFNLEIHDSKSVGNIAVIGGEDPDDPFTPTPPVAGFYIEDNYAANWEFTTEATLTVSTESPSDLGTVKTYVEIEVKSDNSDYLDSLEVATFDEGYGAIGPILFGYTDTIYEYSGAYTLDGGINGGTEVDQIQFSKTLGSWEVAFAAEDPRDRYDDDPKNATGDYPDLALALIRDFNNADIQASFGVTDRTSGTGWAAQLGGTLELANDTINLRGIVAYADNAPEYVGGSNCSGKCANEGGWWSTLISGEIDITSTVALQATASYLEEPSSYEWDAALSAAWSPTDAAEVSVGVLYENDGGSDSVEFHTQLKTTFGD
ncbi:porin [Bauldia sp.]|uniref:porin n=1 Tax=Bauldia sp. TaxID=2575872 RepID=UPI003BAC1672